MNEIEYAFCFEYSHKGSFKLFLNLLYNNDENT
jgi:hypothetical protein